MGGKRVGLWVRFPLDLANKGLLLQPKMLRLFPRSCTGSVCPGLCFPSDGPAAAQVSWVTLAAQRPAVESIRNIPKACREQKCLPSRWQAASRLESSCWFLLLLIQREGCAGVLNVPAFASLLAAFQNPKGTRWNSPDWRRVDCSNSSPKSGIACIWENRAHGELPELVQMRGRINYISSHKNTLPFWWFWFLDGLVQRARLFPMQS